MKLSKRYRQNKKSLSAEYEEQNDPNQLTEADWRRILGSRGQFTQSQRDQVRYTIIHQGVPDKLRGALWAKILGIE